MADNESAPITFINNPYGPEVFADAAAGWFNFNGVVRIAFEAARVNHVQTPGPIDRVVIGRLAMPIDAAENMARGLLAFIEQQKAGAGAPSNATIQ